VLSFSNLTRARSRPVRVPLYYELKLCLVLWLIHPSSLGAVKIFESVVKPLLKTHSSRIEEGISFAEASASHTMSDLR
jgi:hypothetical protein